MGGRRRGGLTSFSPLRERRSSHTSKGTLTSRRGNGGFGGDFFDAGRAFRGGRAVGFSGGGGRGGKSGGRFDGGGGDFLGEAGLAGEVVQGGRGGVIFFEFGVFVSVFVGAVEVSDKADNLHDQLRRAVTEKIPTNFGNVVFCVSVKLTNFIFSHIL